MESELGLASELEIFQETHILPNRNVCVCGGGTLVPNSPYELNTKLNSG